MTSICGIFEFGEKPVLETEIESLCRSMARSSGQTCFVSTFGRAAGIGRLEQIADGKPDDVSVSGCRTIAADAVLTNRAELGVRLDLSPSEIASLTDTELIQRSYLKWGEDCPKYLAGDFAFALWDEYARKLFCSRDHFGGSTLFYYKNNEKLVFASEIRGVLSFADVEKTFNPNKLAILLLPEPHTFLSTETWYKDIFPLPAGTSLTADANGIKLCRYYTPEMPAPLPYKKDEEILEAFRELLFDVIGAHLKSSGSTASLLSGGLDSSSIVSVASKILEGQNGKMNVFSAILPDEEPVNFSDERFYIDQFKDFPNLTINYVSAPGTGPFSDLEELFANFHSPFITSRHYLYTAFSRNAENVGAKTLFDGAFGEAGATFHGHGGFAEMFARFRWAALWKELRQRKKLYRDSIRYNLRANVLNPLLPQALIDIKRGRRTSAAAATAIHPLRKELARKLFDREAFANDQAPRLSPDHRVNQLNAVKFMQEKISEIPSPYFGAANVEVRYPLLDKRLIEFCLTAPLRLKIKNGYSRYLIRAALDGVLPPEIQWRTSKTPFSPDYLRRYNSQIVKVRQMLESVKPNDPVREILDIDLMKKWAALPVADTERYTANERIARDHLPQAVYLLYFLRTFREFRP